MSQNIFSDINPATTSGTQLASTLNLFKDAVASGFSGVARPANLQAGGYWVDTTILVAQNIYRIYLFDGAADVLQYTLNKVTGEIAIPTVTSLVAIKQKSADATAPYLKLWKSRIAALGKVLNGDGLGIITASSIDEAGAEITNAAEIEVVATEDHTAIAQGTNINFYIKKIGTAVKLLVVSIGEGLLYLNGSASGKIGFKAAAATVSYNLTYPAAQGGVDEVLKNNGAGVLSWSAAGGATIVATRAAPTAVVAANGILFTSTTHETINYIEGNGGAVVVTAAARIQAGTINGQRLITIGRSDANTVSLADGNGLNTGGQVLLLKAGSIISWLWDGTEWTIEYTNGLA
jgi:hypothetical protein